MKPVIHKVSDYFLLPHLPLYIGVGAEIRARENNTPTACTHTATHQVCKHTAFFPGVTILITGSPFFLPLNYHFTLGNYVEQGGNVEEIS